jgi:hypothetical protein
MHRMFYNIMVLALYAYVSYARAYKQLGSLRQLYLDGDHHG